MLVTWGVPFLGPCWPVPLPTPPRRGEARQELRPIPASGAAAALTLPKGRRHSPRRPTPGPRKGPPQRRQSRPPPPDVTRRPPARSLSTAWHDAWVRAVPRHEKLTCELLDRRVLICIARSTATPASASRPCRSRICPITTYAAWCFPCAPIARRQSAIASSSRPRRTRQNVRSGKTSIARTNVPARVAKRCDDLALDVGVGVEREAPGHYLAERRAIASARSCS
jgi:hypothetical protein